MTVAVPGQDSEGACRFARQEGPSSWRNQPVRNGFSPSKVWLGIAKWREGKWNRGSMGGKQTAIRSS